MGCVSWQRCLSGSRIISRTLEAMGKERGIALDAIDWLPSINPEQPEPIRETYTLTVVASRQLAYQTLPRESLEYAGLYDGTTAATKVLLGALLRQLSTRLLREQDREAATVETGSSAETHEDNI